VRPGAAARRRLPGPRPDRPGPAVALLRIEGMIVDGRSRRSPLRPPLAPPVVLQDQCGDLTVVEQARALALDRRVGAVVVWVDSGGGSATASESMAAALAALGRRKPVVAAMGSVAGSGGYYVTTAAARVFAHPGTLTGSIGVIAGKLVAGGLLDRLLLGRELVVRGEHSAMWSSEAPFTDAERRKVGELIDRSYRLFLQRVADARGRPVAEIEPVAGGRVWTGSQALRHGLVDELGGLDRALAAARRLGGLPANAPVREARHGRRELTPLPATAATMLEHALRGVAALRQAGTWWLCPLVSEDGT
jgi:protease IV